MGIIKCRNFNHTKINVNIRNCPECGSLVNGNITKARCLEKEHGDQRKSRNTFCTDCGQKLLEK